MATTIHEFLGESDEQIIGRIEQTGNLTKSLMTPQFLLEELSRRGTDRISRLMLKYTRWMMVLTIVILLLTIANVVLVFRSTTAPTPGLRSHPPQSALENRSASE